MKLYPVVTFVWNRFIETNITNYIVYSCFSVFLGDNIDWVK